MSEHSVRAAMERGELDQEEAFFVLRYAGHLGYTEAIRRLRPWSPLKRARRWLVWFGGWERPELLQWDQGKKAFEIKGAPFPLSLFGHRITVQHFGFDIRPRRDALCVHWDRGLKNLKAYISPDCTPGSATTWFFGRRPAR